MFQFSKLANVKSFTKVYFLVIAALQMIPRISFSDGLPVIMVPLTLITIITMIKDLYEDSKRRASDKLENER